MTELERLRQRVEQLESEPRIRHCINRYMTLCDTLDASTPFDELGALFTHDARWEGKGARYAKSFGGYQGRDNIVAMLRSYATKPAHFALNVHYLTSEVIVVDGEKAQASWNMLQVSTFRSGASHLNSARLTVSFICHAGQWQIAVFQTENLFSRPVDTWNSEAELPVPKHQN